MAFRAPTDDLRVVESFGPRPESPYRGEYLGFYDTHITFYSQQVRALELAHA